MFVLTPAGTEWNVERLFPLRIFAHFLHIGRLDIGCKAVHKVQRMQ